MLASVNQWSIFVKDVMLYCHISTVPLDFEILLEAIRENGF